MLNSYMNTLIMGNIIDRRFIMTKEQIKFFEELTSIQEYCVNVTLSKVKEYRNVDELLNGIRSEERRVGKECT